MFCHIILHTKRSHTALQWMENAPKKLLTGLILPTDLHDAVQQDTFAVFVYLVDPHKFVQKLVFDGLA